MNMHWNSMADFLQMGRHGLYVWGSVGMTVLLMVAEPVLLSRSYRQVLNRLRRQQRAEQLDRSILAPHETQGMEMPQ